MDKEQIWEEELYGMLERLNHEVSLLEQSVDNRGDTITKDYSDKVSRAQLKEIASIVEVMSKHVGDGDAVSVTTPDQIQGEKDGN